MNFVTPAYDIFSGIWFAIMIAFIPTVKAILAKPSMLFTPRIISRVFMDALWSQWGIGVDATARTTKEKLLRDDKLGGVVLDVGAGE
jgi:hypothetical protein